MFGIFKRSKANISDNILQEMLPALSYRTNMDRLLLTYGISVSPDTDNRLVQEAASVAAFIMGNALSQAGYGIETLTAAQREHYVVMCLVACDHLSRVADVEFELVGLVAFAALFAEELGPQGAAELMFSAGHTFNRLSSANHTVQTIAEFGRGVAKFFSTSEEKYLIALGVHLKLHLQR
jgi:hypothetical protein